MVKGCLRSCNFGPCLTLASTELELIPALALKYSVQLQP